MKRLTAFVAVAALFGSACASGQGPGNDPGPDPATRRAVLIYEAVIRQLVTEDSSFGPNPQFPVIYLLERARQEAANPEAQGNEEVPLPDDVKSQLLERLADLPIEFISDQDAVIGPMNEGSVVQDEGVVVTVGLIPHGEEQVEVQASLYAGNLAATWLTYVVKRSSQGWQVTGTTGPVAIS